MKKIINHPFARFVIGIVIVGVPYFGIMLFGQSLLTSLPIFEDRLLTTILFIFLGFSVIILYKIYFTFIERKPFFEFAKRNGLSQISNGIIFTILISGVVLLILYLNNNIEITQGNGLGYLPVVFSIAFMSSIAEEILFRGLLFRLSEEKLGSYIAIGISSLLFGIAHYVNPGATILSAVAIGLESGIILSSVYILTRKLWLNISIHFTWNFITGILGVLDKENGGILM